MDKTHVCVGVALLSTVFVKPCLVGHRLQSVVVLVFLFKQGNVLKRAGSNLVRVAPRTKGCFYDIDQQRGFCSFFARCVAVLSLKSLLFHATNLAKNERLPRFLVEPPQRSPKEINQTNIFESPLFFCVGWSHVCASLEHDPCQDR